MSNAPSADLGRAVAQEFRRRMLGEYVPRIRHCLSLMPETRVWQRPGPTCNSVGNLLLHLEGNVRQWILGGVVGLPDLRDRPFEFRASQSEARTTSGALMERLARTVEEACDAVDALGPGDWLALRPFQGGRFEETVVGAVLHVLEHFSGHAGQIYAWTKQATGEDLRFYDL